MHITSATSNLSVPLSEADYKLSNENLLHEIRSISSAVAISIPLFSPLSNKYNAYCKRIFDIMLSIILIVLLLSWILPLLAILIMIDSKGPVFFLQKRIKSRGQQFKCLKFRTMIVNKEADILSSYENDSRITKPGRLLRRFHIDELPQLFNVLLGDMSIVGPRPHMVTENSRFDNLIANYSRRHQIKPGITGMAQSSGNFGASEQMEKITARLDLDLLYIRDWSLGMDIKILLRTVRLIFGIVK